MPVFEIDFHAKMVGVWDCGKEDCGLCDNYLFFHEVEIIEYTGLKDKNGIEIYEGDILFHPLQGKRKVFYPYSETVASYGLRNVDNGMGSTLQDAHRVWEIIGNIYEHNHLLTFNSTE